jgi:hypothetical protein
VRRKEELVYINPTKTPKPQPITSHSASATAATSNNINNTNNVNAFSPLLPTSIAAERVQFRLKRAHEQPPDQNIPANAALGRDEGMGRAIRVMF